MSENNEGVIYTPKIEEEGRIDELTQLKELKNDGAIDGAVDGAIEGAVDGAVDGAIDEATKKYIKISPTFHVVYLSGNTEQEIYRIHNPQTGTVEERALTDDEKHEIFVKELKESKMKFRSTRYVMKNGVVLTNTVVNQFGSAYKQERKRKNRAQKKSRKANR